MLAKQYGRSPNQRRSRRPATSTWAPCAGVCFIGLSLFAVAVVVVASLTPLYLARKGDGIVPADLSDTSRSLKVNAATGVKLSTSESITNLEHIAEQVNTAAGFDPPVLSLASVDVSSAGRKKRADEDTPSCDEGNQMGMNFKVLRCLGKRCATASCFEKCVETIKDRLRKVFGSRDKFFQFITSFGHSHSVPVVLCSFGTSTQNTTTTSTTTTSTTTTPTTTTTTPTTTTPTTTTSTTTVTSSLTPYSATKPVCATVCCASTACTPCIDDSQPSVLACDGSGDAFTVEDCSGSPEGYYSNGGGSGAGSCAFSSVP